MRYSLKRRPKNPKQETLELEPQRSGSRFETLINSPTYQHKLKTKYDRFVISYSFKDVQCENQK